MGPDCLGSQGVQAAQGGCGSRPCGLREGVGPVHAHPEGWRQAPSSIRAGLGAGGLRARAQAAGQQNPSQGPLLFSFPLQPLHFPLPHLYLSLPVLVSVPVSQSLLHCLSVSLPVSVSSFVSIFPSLSASPSLSLSLPLSPSLSHSFHPVSVSPSLLFQCYFTIPQIQSPSNCCNF